MTRHAQKHARRTTTGWLVGLPALLIVAGVLLSTAGTAAPYLPERDDEVVERLPTPARDVNPALREALASLRRDPANLASALGVARHYVALGRAEGDPRYYGYAQAALAPWWAQDKPPLEVLVLRAVLRQAGHDFSRALRDLDLVLEAEPGHAQALLTRAIILQVQGRPAQSAGSCRALSARVAPIVAIACLSSADALGGRAEEGYQRLSGALAAARDTRPELRVWALTLLGEIAGRLGRAGQSEAHFREALSLGERNVYLLGALADLLLDQGRYEAVRELLKDETRADPLLLRLALAESALGDESGAGHRSMLEARFAAGRRRGDSRHLREEARFTLRLLRRPALALELALENWETQREPWDSRLVLAAAQAAGMPETAAPVLAWLRQQRLEDRHIERLAAQLEGSRR